jgi:hypothetical protein
MPRSTTTRRNAVPRRCCTIGMWLPSSRADAIALATRRAVQNEKNAPAFTFLL